MQNENLDDAPVGGANKTAPVLKRTQRPRLLDYKLLNDDQVLTFAEWCKLNGISKRTGGRIIRSGNGPVVTQLSDRRIGITVGNNRRWQEARARSSGAGAERGGE